MRRQRCQHGGKGSWSLVEPSWSETPSRVRKKCSHSPDSTPFFFTVIYCSKVESMGKTFIHYYISLSVSNTCVYVLPIHEPLQFLKQNFQESVVGKEFN